ncbi:MAG: hypothetical protein M9921_07420 [Fimbriimonadaceae bacterium]|nr:hypothetical protein [Fimbriimonadaceae bacterium]
MQRSTKLVAGIVALLVVVGVPALKVYPGPSERERIAVALDESLRASKEGRPGGVLEYLTDQFRINEESPGTRNQIAKLIRDSRPDVVVENREPEIFGDQAKIVSDVEVKASFLGQSLNQRFGNVTLVFKREPTRKYLVFPTHTWRLDQVFLPEGQVDALREGF